MDISIGDALIRLRGMPQPMDAEIDPSGNTVKVCGRSVAASELHWDVPTTGAVYGTLLNFKGALAALGGAVNEAPYKAPPRTPVLYIKPANTWIAYGVPIPMPGDVEAVEIGATLGVVIGRTACRVPMEQALDRPPVRHKCRDGFCPIGPWVVARSHVADADALAVRVYINGTVQQENTTANLIRPVARLIADVTEFLTLTAGDVLLIGVPEDAPLARVGDRVAVEIVEVGRLENPVVAQADLLAETVR
jgi:5-oxopent-3-ene-1,2,5-tricarboxylate decarboxylase/2-hydroxyhepta-2,4-diene-1,7-dioate isomerase